MAEETPLLPRSHSREDVNLEILWVSIKKVMKKNPELILIAREFRRGSKHPSNQQPRRSIKLIPTPEKQSLLKDSAQVDKKLAEYKNQALSNLKEARANLQSQLSESSRKAEQEARRVSLEKRRSAESFIKSAPIKQRKEPVPRAVTSSSVKGEITQPPPAPPANPKAMRENVVKGLADAIKGRIEKSKKAAAAARDEEGKREHSVPSIASDKLAELVRKIEDELYHLYNKEIGMKYKSQYRRLVFNIKDPKNNGLFRKIISGRLSPRRLVEMTPEEMASKELQQWRQAVNKTDIEKIKQHEIEMIKLGNKLVVKSHKGEQVIEAGEGLEEGAGAEAAVIKQSGADELKLPEDDRVFEEGATRSEAKDAKKSVGKEQILKCERCCQSRFIVHFRRRGGSPFRRHRRTNTAAVTDPHPRGTRRDAIRRHLRTTITTRAPPRLQVAITRARLRRRRVTNPRQPRSHPRAHLTNLHHHLRRVVIGTRTATAIVKRKESAIEVTARRTKRM